MLSDDIFIFDKSRLSFRGGHLYTGRSRERDVIVLVGDAPADETGLEGGESAASYTVFPASYENMLRWDGALAPQPRLIALNHAGYGNGFGSGNRMVISQKDVACLRERSTLGGWDGIFAALLRSAVPFWFVQQSIVRELIPEGADPEEHAGIGHTGGYGPREFLRAGLFAYASLGGYRDGALPIGADADHAIVTGHDEESLAHSLAFNKLALDESAAYTKYTVDTSHLFHFPVEIGPAESHHLLAAFKNRRFAIPNILPGREGFTFEFNEEEVQRLAAKYWQACCVHKELYDHVAARRGARPFDYELSLDETPEPTPVRELLFYMVVLHDVLGIPRGGVASAGPNIAFNKRYDFVGALDWLVGHANASASVLHHFGAMLSAHSADGVSARTGKGVGVDEALLEATGGRVELKVADVYQEVLWQVLATSPEAAEREIFREAWQRTYEAAGRLAAIYRGDLSRFAPGLAARLLTNREWQEGIAARHGEEAVRLTQGVAGYGLPLFQLADDLHAATDPGKENPEAELFRRFMFLTYRSLRPAIFVTLGRAGWERLAAAIEEATMIRLRAMQWTK